MTEKDKMLAGELYNSFDEALVHERLQAKELCHAFNNSPLGDNELPSVILKQLFGRAGKNLAQVSQSTHGIMRKLLHDLNLEKCSRYLPGYPCAFSKSISHNILRILLVLDCETWASD